MPILFHINNETNVTLTKARVDPAFAGMPQQIAGHTSSPQIEILDGTNYFVSYTSPGGKIHSAKFDTALGGVSRVDLVNAIGDHGCSPGFWDIFVRTAAQDVSVAGQDSDHSGETHTSSCCAIS